MTAFAARRGPCWALAYASLVEGFDHGRVSVVAPLNATQSVWAVVLAALLIGRRPSASAVGPCCRALLVLAGGAMISVLR